MINLTLSLHHRGSSRVSALQFLSLYICSLWHSVQARIHTGGFHRFTKIVQIFHNKYIFSKNVLKNFKNSPSWNLENGLDSQNISCLNDSETQEKGFWGVKILKISRVSMPPDLPKSRESVSIYCRSTPGVLLRRREIDPDLTKRSNCLMSRDYEKLSWWSAVTGIYILKHTAFRLQCRCQKANSSTCNFPSNQGNVLKSLGVCASNWFFAKNFLIE